MLEFYSNPCAPLPWDVLSWHGGRDTVWNFVMPPFHICRVTHWGHPFPSPLPGSCGPLGICLLSVAFCSFVCFNSGVCSWAVRNITWCPSVHGIWIVEVEIQPAYQQIARSPVGKMILGKIYSIIYFHGDIVDGNVAMFTLGVLLWRWVMNVDSASNLIYS